MFIKHDIFGIFRKSCAKCGLCRMYGLAMIAYVATLNNCQILMRFGILGSHVPNFGLWLWSKGIPLVHIFGIFRKSCAKFWPLRQIEGHLLSTLIHIFGIFRKSCAKFWPLRQIVGHLSSPLIPLEPNWPRMTGRSFILLVVNFIQTDWRPWPEQMIMSKSEVWLNIIR